MTYLNFVTLQTGSMEQTMDPGSSATVPAALDLARALRDGISAVAGRPGYTIKALTAERSLVCTVYGPAGQPLTTFGVAPRSLGAAELWTMLHDGIPMFSRKTDPKRPPAVPWCAVRVEESMLTDPNEPWRWLAAFELEIAWAWINKRHRSG